MPPEQRDAGGQGVKVNRINGKQKTAKDREVL